MPEPALDLLAEARRLDPDRSLALAFAEPGDRPLLASLVLFNAELARIPELVNEPMAGMIRYQWWHEAVANAADAKTADSSALGQHPVLPALAAGLADGRLDSDTLVALIEAREAELDRLQPVDLGALEAYASATSGRLHRLLARACGGDESTLALAERAGTGFALVGLVRALRFHAAQGRLLLPADLLADAEVTPEAILAAGNAEALARAAGVVLASAQEHLEAVRRAGRLPRRVLPALLPAVLARRHARRLTAAGPLGSAAEARDGWAVPALLWHWLRRRV